MSTILAERDEYASKPAAQARNVRSPRENVDSLLALRIAVLAVAAPHDRRAVLNLGDPRIAERGLRFRRQQYDQPLRTQQSNGVQAVKPVEIAQRFVTCGEQFFQNVGPSSRPPPTARCLGSAAARAEGSAVAPAELAGDRAWRVQFQFKNFGYKLGVINGTSALHL